MYVQMVERIGSLVLRHCGSAWASRDGDGVTHRRFEPPDSEATKKPCFKRTQKSTLQSATSAEGCEFPHLPVQKIEVKPHFLAASSEYDELHFEVNLKLSRAGNSIPRSYPNR